MISTINNLNFEHIKRIDLKEYILDNLDMKKINLLIILSPLLLSSCVFFQSDEDEYKTPELFLDKMSNISTIEMKSSKEGYQEIAPDYDKSVYYALSEIKEYEEITSIHDPSDIYFTYGIFNQNIATLSVYENGYIEIYRKQKYSSPHSFYYSFSPYLAASLNRLVEEKIKYAIEAKNDAEIEANNYANITNFFIDAKKNDYIYSLCADTNRIYDFKAYIDIVNKMEEATYTLSEEYISAGYLIRYGSNTIEFPWMYSLLNTYKDILLMYNYSDKVNRSYTIEIRYTIDEDMGRDIYRYVLDIARRTNLNGY